MATSLTDVEVDNSVWVQVSALPCAVQPKNGSIRVWFGATDPAQKRSGNEVSEGDTLANTGTNPTRIIALSSKPVRVAVTELD